MVIGALLVFWVMVKVLPEQVATGGITDASKRDEALGRARTAILAIVAGSLAGVGAYYTHRTFGLNRQGQINERFTRAVDQLGHSFFDVRIGGIYALERVARESRDDHGPIMEILTAYIRVRRPPDSQDQAATEASGTRSADAGGLRSDVQAAMTVLGRRTRAYDPPKPWVVNLAAAHLEGANLLGAHLEEANLKGAHLERADLTGAHLDGADLTGAHLDGADLTGAYLDGADLTGAHLDGADLTGAHLKGARVTGA